jgi:hypothetical protein
MRCEADLMRLPWGRRQVCYARLENMAIKSAATKLDEARDECNVPQDVIDFVLRSCRWLWL